MTALPVTPRTIFQAISAGSENRAFDTFPSGNRQQVRYSFAIGETAENPCEKTSYPSSRF
ncbi:hypothetical protein [Shinella fusca]|jgi:hypothetical protein|uniref:Uncharacterized protein n=1 Tax=Shinella fusca TaxID=544480 RepID=A0A7W7YUW5_9HYPH|nr:hypothetical protein [Shinella fusca]MBB5042818.1 hypothetical protein [Shinella fusca]